MKIKLRFPINGVDANVRALDADGEEVQVDVLEIEPLFFNPQSQVNVLFGEVNVSGDGVPVKTTHRYAIAVGGNSGVCRLVNRMQPVPPMVERNKAPTDTDGKDAKATKKSARPSAGDDIEVPAGGGK